MSNINNSGGRASGHRDGRNSARLNDATPTPLRAQHVSTPFNVHQVPPQTSAAVDANNPATVSHIFPSRVNQPPLQLPLAPAPASYQPAGLIPPHLHKYGFSEIAINTGIPPMNVALADFNSIPARQNHRRDIPSTILAHIHGPVLTLPEPDWAQLLSYFQSSEANSKHRVGEVPPSFPNLQDLFILLVRVVLPNLIVRNRQYLLEMYITRPGTSLQHTLRYDQWNKTVQSRADMDQMRIVQPISVYIPLSATINMFPHSIFSSRLNPVHFTQWLATNPHPARTIEFGPIALAHQVSELDQLLEVPETTVRGWTFGDLMRRTIRVLHIFWWLVNNNHDLERYRQNGWLNVEARNPPNAPCGN